MDYLTFTWGIEKGLELGFITIRWYSLLFALGFILGYILMGKIFDKEGIPRRKLDTLLNYAVIGTVVGARLGHVFFYEWEYYSQNIIEIFKVWEGGLASHGAAIALIVAMYFYGKRVVKKGMLWSLDRLVITVALAGCFIRLGNWMNSEIYGRIGNSSIETVFTTRTTDPFEDSYDKSYFNEATMTNTGDRYLTDSVDYPIYSLELQINQGISSENAISAFSNVARNLNSRANIDRNMMLIEGEEPKVNDGILSVRILGIPRLPTQLIESLGYLIIFFILFKLYQTGNFKDRRGYLFGTFLTLVFGFRFFVEFYKANQTIFENNLTFNMGQWLSIPLVVIGLVMMLKAKVSQNTSIEKEE